MIDVETAAPSLYVGRNVRILCNVKQEQKKMYNFVIKEKYRDMFGNYDF